MSNIPLARTMIRSAVRILKADNSPEARDDAVALLEEALPQTERKRRKTDDDDADASSPSPKGREPPEEIGRQLSESVILMHQDEAETIYTIAQKHQVTCDYVLALLSENDINPRLEPYDDPDAEAEDGGANTGTVLVDADKGPEPGSMSYFPGEDPHDPDGLNRSDAKPGSHEEANEHRDDEERMEATEVEQGPVPNAEEQKIVDVCLEFKGSSDKDIAEACGVTLARLAEVRSKFHHMLEDGDPE